jgi:hypothetical protein
MLDPTRSLTHDSAELQEDGGYSAMHERPPPRKIGGVQAGGVAGLQQGLDGAWPAGPSCLSTGKRMQMTSKRWAAAEAAEAALQPSGTGVKEAVAAHVTATERALAASSTPPRGARRSRVHPLTQALLSFAGWVKGRSPARAQPNQQPRRTQHERNSSGSSSSDTGRDVACFPPPIKV